MFSVSVSVIQRWNKSFLLYQPCMRKLQTSEVSYGTDLFISASKTKTWTLFWWSPCYPALHLQPISSSQSCTFTKHCETQYTTDAIFGVFILSNATYSIGLQYACSLGIKPMALVLHYQIKQLLPVGFLFSLLYIWTERESDLFKVQFS